MVRALRTPITKEDAEGLLSILKQESNGNRGNE